MAEEVLSNDLTPTTTGHIPAQHGVILGRILDPVRAHALTEAVALVGPFHGDMVGRAEAAGSALAVAKEFEAYLAGEEPEDEPE